MRRLTILVLLLVLFMGHALASEDLFGTGAVERALPREAASLLEGRSPGEVGGFSESLKGLVRGAIRNSRGEVPAALLLTLKIMAVVILSAVLRGSAGELPNRAMGLAATLAVGAVCLDRISGFFALASRTVDSVTAFSGFLFSALASATAATGAVGTSTALYGGTVLLCSLMTRGAEALLLPGISCYMALSVADSALGDGSLKVAGDTVKQLMTSLLKLTVLAFTAYLSLSGVVSGSADSAAVKAAKLAISSAVPVVGSMVADASETLLVSAGLIRSGLGIFGMLGVLAVCAGPFFRTGIQYLMLKTAAAAAAIVGEKELSSLISAMAGAMGLLAGLTGACGVILVVACVCFMQAGG